MTPRFLLRAVPVLAALLTPAANAHFVFVVPDAPEATATGQPGGVSVLMSENLEPDAEVPVAIVSGAELSVRDADGTQRPLDLGPADGDRFRIDLPAAADPEAPRVVRGLVDLGFTRRGDGPGHLLLYHPKTILGDALAPSTRLRWGVPVELVPVADGGGARLVLLGNGQPLAGAEVTVIHPDGREEVVTTDARGRTPVLAAGGRYGAWARFWVDADGERDGEAFTQIRHYATLVFDADRGLGGAGAAAPGAAAEEAPAADAGHAIERIAALPEAAASGGIAAAGGWLYAYGGHVTPTHAYHREAVSGAFHRARLDRLAGGDASAWEALPAGEPLQGMNLAALGGKLYLAGGMQPQNREGHEEDNRSVADARVFDPAAGAWGDLPLLPEPRSSHDLVALGGKLWVVGGWHMHGRAQTWSDTILCLDPAAESPRWEARPQPFRRRALIAAAFEDRLWVIGGMNDAQKIPAAVSIYDPASNAWADGPPLPAGRFNGFSPAACVAGGRLYVSVADGTLLRLSAAKDAWEEVARAAPRVVHRMVADEARGRLLLAGGAWDGDNLDRIDAVEIPGLAGATPGTPEADADAPPDAAAAAASAAAAAAQTHCPVMPKVGVSEASRTVFHRGHTVRLCCRLCVKHWNADPLAFADPDLLPQLRAAPSDS
ncbi:hypothetical protein [Phycisphaera mikurensis]|uniref:N-acetylneuraminate epimerase n=1 Tax=Phycisphaera mikurensis (strain NBRC 102666 / KCTC 22515 / FYK2301M01) TaxID=1142394 RepID=I0IHN2_PHYMF|nr:hypothetical protein [Phycisphaera mikurensis]MBB6441015.1 hypothetical protein [Phycisphaera mikurensis]BAM04770.1 hypothetical protein PSMK_26110 [Phycisphaera mikurensis NBRC 102666]